MSTENISQNARSGCHYFKKLMMKIADYYCDYAMMEHEQKTEVAENISCLVVEIIERVEKKRSR